MNFRLPVLVVLFASSLLLHAQAKVRPAKPGAKPAPTKAKQAKPLELNLASKAELMKLPGIDEALAVKIIAGRPYLTKTNLVTRNILPIGVFKPIRHMVSARQAPAAK